MPRKRKRSLCSTAIVLVVTLMSCLLCGTISAAAQASYGETIYLKTDQTQTPYIHYWYLNDKGGSSWPGVPMSKVSGEDDLFFYDLPYDISELNGVIFNRDGSGDKMTGDVTGITGNLYTLSTGKWSMYDTSSIKIRSYTGTPESSVYTGQTVALSMEAEGGDGNLSYKISVKGAEDKVISDYSSKSSAAWTPQTAGECTVVFEVKDGSGDHNSRELTYTVIDAATAVEPVLLGAVPANRSQIKNGDSATITLKGSGGNVNNNVLFYKAEIIDPNGNAVNTPYYKTGNKFTFTPSMEGTYTVYVSVQNNTKKNTTVKDTYFYYSKNNPSSDPEIDIPVPVTGVKLDKSTLSLTIGESAVLKATVEPTNADDKNVLWSSSNTKVATVENGTVKAVGKGSATITVKTRDGSFEAKCAVTVISDGSDILMGDYDGNGKVESADSKAVQKAALGELSLTAEQKERCDVNGDGKITLMDAALIKQLVEGEITSF